MKTTKKALRIPVLFVAIAGLIITAFSSCSQDDDNCPAPNVLAVAHASVVNALPGSQPLNFILTATWLTIMACRMAQG